MKKAMFFGSRGQIANVYTDEMMRRLAETLDFVEPVYSKAELASRPDTKEVKYIFSTWGMIPLTEDEIAEYLPSLEAVFYAAGSVQFFASPFLKRGVAVFSAWGANGVPVAQFAVAEILLALKGVFATLHNGHGESWENHSTSVRFPGIMDAKVGVIGAGMIGKMVIAELSRYPIEVLVYDKFLSSDEISALGKNARKAELCEIFSECFAISNHLANLPATVGMLGYEHFSLMRDGAVFINTGRGAQVRRDDMIRALRENPTRAAVLDVTYPDEPPKPGDELYVMRNVFLTPHIAGSIGCEVHRMAEYMYEEYVSFDAGEPVRFRVTEEMLDRMA